MCILDPFHHPSSPTFQSPFFLFKFQYLMFPSRYIKEKLIYRFNEEAWACGVIQDHILPINVTQVPDKLLFLPTNPQLYLYLQPSQLVKDHHHFWKMGWL